MDQSSDFDWSKFAMATAGFINSFSLEAKNENSNISNSSALVRRDTAESSRYTENITEQAISWKQAVSAVLGGLEVANAICNDRQHYTVRNTVEAAAGVTGGYLGASIEAAAGAGFGKRGVLPSVSETVGGAIGAVAGTLISQAIAEQICDANELNIERRICRLCGSTFIAKLYRGESIKYKCDACQ